MIIPEPTNRTRKTDEQRPSPARRTVEAALARGGMTRAARTAAKKRLRGLGRKGKASRS